MRLSQTVKFEQTCTHAHNIMDYFYQAHEFPRTWRRRRGTSDLPWAMEHFMVVLILNTQTIKNTNRFHLFRFYIKRNWARNDVDESNWSGKNNSDFSFLSRCPMPFAMNVLVVVDSNLHKKFHVCVESTTETITIATPKSSNKNTIFYDVICCQSCTRIKNKRKIVKNECSFLLV